MTYNRGYSAAGSPVALPGATPFPSINRDVNVNPYVGSSSPPSGDYNRGSVAPQTALLEAATGMSGGDAVAQSEAALAKLAAVNPQLAQELLEKRTDSGSGGLFGFVGDVASTIFSPALSAAGDFLEILGRTSHIVPQWFDPNDEGNWAEDIGQALSGEDKTNWNEVFQARGWLKDAGWLRAAVGFGLDIATDPLTYATFGAGAGVSAETKAAGAARTVIGGVSKEGASPFVARLAELGGTSVDDASQFLLGQWNRFGGVTDNIATIRRFQEGGAEEVIGAFGRASAAEVRGVVADAFDAGAQAYRKVYGRTWKNFLQRGDTLMSSIDPERALLSSADAKPLFESIARGGNFTSYRAGEWGAGKAAAGAMGGLRFRFAVPFTQLRYISPMVPGSYKLGMGFAARFGSGMSAFKMVEKVGPDAERLFAERGWRGIVEAADNAADPASDLAKSIIGKAGAGRTSFVRSALYQASEQAGSLTAHLSPGARMYRKGLGQYIYRQGLRNAADTAARLRDDLFYKVNPLDSSGSSVRTDLFRRYDRALGPKALKAMEKRAPGTSVQFSRDARLYLDYFGHEAIPRSVGDVQSGKLDDWFWHANEERNKLFLSQRQHAANNVPFPMQPEYNAQLAVLEDMKRVLGTIKDDTRLVLDDMVGTESFGKTTLERHGGDVGDVAMGLTEARVIHPDDVAAHFPPRPEYLQQDFQAVLTPGKTREAAKFTGVSADMSVPHADLGVSGVRLDLTGGGTKTIPVQLRIQKVVDVDLDDLENVVPAARADIEAGTATLPQILAAYDKEMADTAQGLAKELNPVFDNHILRTEWDLTQRAELATKVLRSRPDAPQAIRFMRGDTPESMVVFDWDKVHHVTETAPLLRPKGGYFRRTLSPALRAKLGGEARKGEARLFGDPGAIETSFRRETRNMTLPEAEAYVRNKVNQSGGPYDGITIGDAEDVFDWDIKRGHEAYIDYLSESYFSTATGRTTARMLQLGQLVPAEFSNVARTARAAFEMPQARLRELARSDKALQNAFVKLQQRMATEEERSFRTLAERHTRLATEMAYLDAGLTGEDIPGVQLVSAMDGVVRSSANLQKVVAAENKRLGAVRAQLDTELQLAKQVERDLSVEDWDDVDAFITGRSNRVLFAEDEVPPDMPGYLTRAEQDELNSAPMRKALEDAGLLPPNSAEREVERRMAARRREEVERVVEDVDGEFRAEPSTHQTWKDETTFLKAAQAKGDAVEIEPGVWKYKRTFGFKEDVYVATTRVGDEDRVIAYRAVANGEEATAGGVVAATAADLQGQGFGTKLILAHWRDAGVKDFASVKRMVSDQSLTDAAVRLNMRAARRILAENGIYEPEVIRDLIRRGEVYAGKDGSIWTKAGGIRKGGKRVRAVEDVTQEAHEVESVMAQLDDLRKGAPVPLAGGGVAEEAVTGMTRAQRGAASRFDKATEKAETAVLGALARSEKASFKRGQVMRNARVHVTNASNEMNRAQAQLQGAWAEVKPAMHFDLPPTGGKSLMREVQVPGLGGVYAHPYVAEEMEHLFRGRPVGHLRGLWREWMLGPWKRWATYRNPGFHVRNNFGAWFNNTLGGVDAVDYEFSRIVNMARGNKKAWATTAVEDKYWKRYNLETLMPGMKGQVTYGDMSEMLADMGLGRSNTKATAATFGSESTSRAEQAAGKVKTGLRYIDDKLRAAGGLTEDFHRVAAWGGGMRVTKGDVYGARAFTMMRHGDYADLTDTEDFIRDLVPFYKWMRTNVPYQMRMMAENPGYLLAVSDKAQTFVYDVQGMNRYQEEFKQPEWMQRGFQLPIPKGVPFVGGTILTEDLPYSDLYNGARDYLSAGLPMIRNVVESYGIRQSVFTGAPLGNKMVPLSGIFDNPVMEPLVAALPWAQRGTDGRVFIPDTMDNVLSAVPLYSRFHNWMLSDPDRVENRVSTFTSALLGFGIRRDDLTAAELGFYYDELLPAMDRMKSLGYTLPTAEQLADAGAAVHGYGQAPNAEDLFPGGVAATAQAA